MHGRSNLNNIEMAYARQVKFAEPRACCAVLPGGGGGGEGGGVNED